MHPPDLLPTWTQDIRPQWYEGPLLGNGDLGVVAFGGDRLSFAVGKNDVWDRRLLTKLQKPLTFQAHIHDQVPRIGRDLRAPPREWATVPPEDPSRYIQPKPVCRVEVLAAGAGTHALSLALAELATRIGELLVTARVHQDRNLISLDFAAPDPVVVRLVRRPDGTATGIAPPSHRVEGELGLITQVFPAETTYPAGFRVAVAAAFAGAGAPRLAGEGLEWRLAGQARLCLAVVTTRDAADPEAAAVHLLRQGLADPQDLDRRHREAWRTYWGKSWIRVSDPLLQDLWYLHQYFFACATRPGAVAPGVFGPWIVEDTAMWSGSCTTDYNFEQTFAAALGSNHAERMGAYFETLEGHLPAAREWARDIFGAEGAAFAHELFPLDMHGQMRGNSAYVAETPFLVQHFWEYYLYTLDLDFLVQRAYPLLAAAADFLAHFATQTRPGRYEFIPTRSCEHHLYDPRLAFHQNGTTELGFARYLFKAAVAAARLVGEADPHRVEGWAAVLRGLPEFPRLRTAAGEIFLDTIATDPAADFLPPVSTEYLAKLRSQTYSAEMRPSKQPANSGGWMIYNCPTSLWHVWPAGEIDADSKPEDLLAAIRTFQSVRMEGMNDLLARHMIAARLGLITLEEFKEQVGRRLLANGTLTYRMNDRFRDMTEAVRRICEPFGVYTENFAFPMVLNEMMLQSHGGVLRFFPVFDPYLTAEFHQLRARGGFTVSGGVEYGYVAWAEIVASVETDCRVRLFGPAALLRLEEKATRRPVACTVDGTELVFTARAGICYRLAPLPPESPA